MDLTGFKTAGPTVVLDGVNEKLLEVAATLDGIHQRLFGNQMIITSARDGQHAPGSLHAAGKAFDVRTIDKSESGALLFLLVIAFLGRTRPIAVFDERNLPGNPHFHIEWHGA
jgi:hypothetical protein